MNRPLILIAEDDELIRSLMCEILESIGANVVTTVNADSAFDAFKQLGEELVLVVTDVRMPGVLDGYGLARLVKEQRPSLPVVVTSGYTGEQQYGTPTDVTFLAKPWSFQQFASAVRPFLQGL